MSNEGSLFLIDFARRFFNFPHIKNHLFKTMLLNHSAKISFKITDKASIFDDLSVSKTHFTDKPAFPSDLSVNFWPLWWWFTDKSRFLDHLSVKPRSKPSKSYGQTAIFDHFVRNRHFSSRPFTDRRPIFIDISVNGSDFSKCSAHSVSTPSHQSKLPTRFASAYFHHGRRSSCIRKKTGWFAIWDIVFFSIFAYTNYTSSHLFCKITLLF